MKGKVFAIIAVVSIAVLIAVGVIIWYFGTGRSGQKDPIGRDTALKTYEWTCPNCNTDNITLNVEPLVTCEKCGERRYLDMEPWDCACGRTGNQWFDCPACGEKRPE